MLLLGQEVTEMKKNAPDGLGEFKTANSRLHPKTFPLIITKNFKAKALRKQLVPEKSCFSVTHAFLSL